MIDERREEQASLYALGALDADEINAARALAGAATGIVVVSGDGQRGAAGNGPQNHVQAAVPVHRSSIAEQSLFLATRPG